MTNAIEQSKREMYEKWKDACKISVGIRGCGVLLEFEQAMEAYLELLRQDLSAPHETARKRFEDIQSLEAVNKDLIEQLSKMTERRDYFRNQVQAANHACESRQDQPATPTQDSGDLASCATLDGKTAAILGAVVDCQRIIREWGAGGLKAKRAIRAVASVVNGRPSVCQAFLDFEVPTDDYGDWFINNTQCMHSFHPAFPSGEQCVFCGVGK